MKASSTPLDEQDDQDVPPAIACALCGREECIGLCSAVTRVPGGLPWEGADFSLARLWQTAELSALDPDFVFGRMGRGRLGAALLFGVVCEGLALASLGVCAVLVLGLLWPEPLTAWLGSSLVWSVILLGWLGTTAGMLLIHVLWGACMELGAKLAGSEADQQRGFRFGMYSTGWDLLTSPAGIALSLAFRGWSSFVEPLTVAARIPRKAVDAYLIDCRGFDQRTRKRAFQVTVGAFVVVFVLVLVVAVVAFVHWLRAMLT